MNSPSLHNANTNVKAKVESVPSAAIASGCHSDTMSDDQCAIVWRSQVDRIREHGHVCIKPTLMRHSGAERFVLVCDSGTRTYNVARWRGRWITRASYNFDN